MENDQERIKYHRKMIDHHMGYIKDIEDQIDLKIQREIQKEVMKKYSKASLAVVIAIVSLLWVLQMP